MTTTPVHDFPSTRDGAWLAPAQASDPLGIYVHIPFCAHICSYCDFNTYSGQSSRIPAYVEAVCRETGLWAAACHGRVATSLFLGGGTPSLLTGEQVAPIIAACAAAFEVAADAEITLEANPNDLSPRLCHDLLAAGVNRLSIGAQTFDHRGLRILGRLHGAEQTRSALHTAHAAGFSNISLDLIYGWPGQSLQQWRSDLISALSGEGAAPNHLSLYSLIVEPGTPMADAVRRGILTPVDDDASADFAELADHLLSEAGWIHYEIANWSAAPQFASRHNATYWRNGDYVGLGAGAHGHLGNVRVMNQPSPRRYIETLALGGSPRTNSETIDGRTAMAETMMLGLRLLQDGVDDSAFAQRHGIALVEQFGEAIARMTALGLLQRGDGRVRLTPRGVLLANSVCAEFI